MNTKEKLEDLAFDVDNNWEVYLQVLRYYRWPQLITSKEDRVEKWKLLKRTIENVMTQIDDTLEMCNELEEGDPRPEDVKVVSMIRNSMTMKKKGLSYEIDRVDRIINLYTNAGNNYKQDLVVANY